MKSLLKTTAQRFGGHLYSRGSLPTGVNWLLDIQRAQAIDRDPLFFDVGANVGQTVAEFRKVFTGSRIHAFEPFAGPRTALTAATQADPLVTVVPLAMGSAQGTVRVRPNAVSEMSSLVQQSGDHDAPDSELIQVDTVDRYCEMHDITSLDILKTDTEGYDLEVLRGACGLLGRQSVTFIYTEVTFEHANRQNTAFGPTFELLSDHGYRFLGLYETYSLHHFEEPHLFCNALFASRERFRCAR